jgi:lysozyme
MTTEFLIPDLEHDEGLRLTAYQDTKGIWTCGYGHAYVAPGTVWTLAHAQAQLLDDIAHTEALLDLQLPWWRTLDDVRQDVLVEMGFNMGVTNLCGFHITLAAIQAHNWPAAKAGMLDSDWAKPPPIGVGERAERLAEQMLTGVHSAALATG